jgi:hypothetical protein
MLRTICPTKRARPCARSLRQGRNGRGCALPFGSNLDEFHLLAHAAHLQFVTRWPISTEPISWSFRFQARGRRPRLDAP